MIIKVALSDVKYLCSEHFTYIMEDAAEGEKYLVETQDYSGEVHSCDWEIPHQERYCEDPDALKISKVERYEL